MAKTVATIMGVVFILAGLVGFVSNDLLGFHLTAFHNAGVHIVSGAVSLYFGLKGTLRGRASLIWFSESCMPDSASSVFWRGAANPPRRAFRVRRTGDC